MKTVPGEKGDIEVSDREFERVTTLAEIIKSVAELPNTRAREDYCKERGFSFRHIYTMSKRYAGHGLPGLLRKPNSSRGKMRSCSEGQRKAIEEMYLQPTCPSMKKVFADFRLKKEQLGLSYPSYGTMRRILREIPNKVANLARHGSKNYDAIPSEKRTDETDKIGKMRHENKIGYQKIDNRPVFGEKIDFPGLAYEPVEEHSVIYLFGLLANKLGFEVEAFQSVGIDCEAKRKLKNRRWQRVRIEFEFKSSNFVQHNHSITDCDLIVCWEHDWNDCPLEVLELKKEILRLRNE